MKKSVREQLESYLRKQNDRLNTLKEKETHYAESGGYIAAHETRIRIIDLESTISHLEDILN